MLDLNKLAADFSAGAGKVDSVAGKVEAGITAGGPEAVKVLEEVRAFLREVGPVFQAVEPLVGMLANFFPHANPPAPAGQQ
jgi:hypothetical protein